MLENYSSRAGKYIAIAESIAFDLGHCNVGSEHLLLSFLKLKDNKLRKELEKYNINYDSVCGELLEVFPASGELPFYMEYTTNLKEILKYSQELSKKLNEDKISEDVLMLSLIEKDETITREILLNHGVNLEEILNKLKVKKVCLLDSVEELTNLNKKMLENPVKIYKRDKEIKLIENILLKKQKANVLIVGEAGVGKSALVEYLAYKIATGGVKNELKDKVVYELDISLSVAGTKYRGEFEEKLKKILKKVREDQNAILFIDEMHNIIGAGGAEGAIDASNILKPYLARKDISCIGATTYDEYIKFIEKEKAVDRRFTTLFLDELNIEDVKDILINIKEDYKEYHDIEISNDICFKIVDYLDKYVKEKKFPDKAIDVLDYACVLAREKKQITLDESDVKEAISELYKIDLDNRNIFYLNKKLKEKIIGQDNIIDKICENLSIPLLKEKNRPLGVYLFLGDSGVGKTELAKEIANNYFKEDCYVKIAMESYSDTGSVSKILGANPGYIGYDSDSYLLEKIKNNPCSVIILDEIEKANKEVINLFLNVFDEGYIIDSKKRKIDFSNSIIIMTSNLGFNKIDNNLGFNVNKVNDEEIDKFVKRFFKEELLNRVDDVFIFNSLDKSDYVKIAENYLDRYKEQIDIKKIKKNIDNDIRGVRDLKKKLKTEIAKELLREREEIIKVS